MEGTFELKGKDSVLDGTLDVVPGTVSLEASHREPAPEATKSAFEKVNNHEDDETTHPVPASELPEPESTTEWEGLPHHPGVRKKVRVFPLFAHYLSTKP